MNSTQKFRLRLAAVCVILAALILVMALYATQIMHGQSYAEKANKQYVKPTVALFDRGSIFFSGKDTVQMTAATVAEGYLVYMNPSLISSTSTGQGYTEQVYKALSGYIKLDQSDFMKRAAKSNDFYEELAHRVPAETAEKVATLGIAGIGIIRETWRSYPAADMSAQTIGLIGQMNQVVEGRYGLERSYEGVLKRSSIGSDANMFAQLFSGANSNGTQDHKGDVVTSLEPTVETFVSKVLNDTVSVWHPDEIGGIVMDPKTGEIVAAISLPSFDPNNTSKVKDVKIFSNPLVENVYEMGSIMKPLTIATGLDSGAINMNFSYDDTGTLTLSGKKISNYDGKARGVIPLQQILSQSLNVGAATVALKAGASTMSSYFSSFGLGQKTGIDLPNEATGLIGNLKSGRDIDTATASFGQGIAVSPIEMIHALGILANGGYAVQPHLVKSIEYDDGTSQAIAVKRNGPFLRKQTVEDVTGMLVKVVDTALKKGAKKREHYSVAAKTGTAQIPDHVNGGYYTDRYLHSFFGYFPAYDPRFIIFLYQVYPRGAEYAADTLTNPFDEIVGFLIDYYNIPPDR
jgi:cell division protein FtsI/penicillin-binding protein 2